MPNKPKMTSSELGALWMTYQKKTLILRYLEYFIETAENEKARNLMSIMGSTSSQSRRNANDDSSGRRSIPQRFYA